MALPFVVCSSLFFASGGYFCWAVVFKVGYAFFIAQYASIGVTPTIRISEYLAFSAKLMLAFGLTFEMPIFAVLPDPARTDRLPDDAAATSATRCSVSSWSRRR